MATRENERAIKRAIASAMRGVVSRYAVTRGIDLTDEERANILDALRGVWRYSVEREGRAIIDEFKDCYSHLETKADEETLWDQIVEEYVQQYGLRAAQRISDTTRDQMLKLINKGLKEGLSIDQMVRDMRAAIPSVSSLRAHVISRTETHSSSMFGSLGVAKASGRALVKIWSSNRDHRTRDFGEADGVIDMFNHRTMNGIEIDLHAPFMVPNKYGIAEPMMFPGDPNGSAGNVIMCRCAMTYRRVVR